MARVEFTAEDARNRFADMLDQVHAGGARVVLTYRGKPRAVVLSYADFQRLEGAGEGHETPGEGLGELTT